MIDSPKAFVIIIIAFLLSLSLIHFAVDTFNKQADEQASFDLSVNTKGDSQSSGGTKSSESSTKSTPSSNQTGGQNNYTVDSVTPNVPTDYVVRLTQTGFEPAKLTIPSGKSVRFLNASSATMFVVAAPSPNNTGINELNQGRSVGRGGYYDFTFTKKGTFVYYNQNDRTKTGVIETY